VLLESPVFLRVRKNRAAFTFPHLISNVNPFSSVSTGFLRFFWVSARFLSENPSLVVRAS